MPSKATLLTAVPPDAFALASSSVMDRTSGDLSCAIPWTVSSKAPHIKLRKVRMVATFLSMITSSSFVLVRVARASCSFFQFLFIRGRSFGGSTLIVNLSILPVNRKGT
jgi:hypothetical protein